VYRKRFLGVELQPWHIAHSEHFSNAKWAQKDRTVQEYFVQVFAPLANMRAQSDGWDTTAGWVAFQQLNTAHTFFANLDRHIKDVMLNDDTFEGIGFEDWRIHNLYTKAIVIETSALYVSQKAARTAAKGIQRQIAAVAVDRAQKVESINAIRDTLQAQQSGTDRSSGRNSRDDEHKKQLTDSGTSIRDWDRFGTGVTYFGNWNTVPKSRLDDLDWVKK
jgi:hypothetical protein